MIFILIEVGGDMLTKDGVLVCGMCFATSGRTPYSVLVGMWRSTLKMCYSQCQVDLLKISKDVEMGTIEARWRTRGRLRAPWTTRER